MRIPDDHDACSGYAPLLWIDLETGVLNGSEVLYVPFALADSLNAARRELYNKRDQADAWRSAGAVRMPARRENGAESDTGPVAGDTAAQLRAVQATLDASAAALAAHPVSLLSSAKRRARVRGTRTGRVVPVISSAQITDHRQTVEQRIKLSSAEKKAELKFIDELLARGESRTVGLKDDWRFRIAQMRSDMPNLSKVIDRLEACCALSAFARKPLRIPPLLLIGAAGVGKTHFAKRVADVLGVPRFIYMLESAETVSVLTGSEKHWSNSESGQLFRLVVQGEFANPVIVLDELDKVSAGTMYRPANALHGVLERATAKQLRDKCIDLTFDASYVVYIATANRLSPIDSSLVSRFELFHIEAPEPREAVAIARAVARRLLHDLNLTRRFAKPAGEMVQQLALLGSPRRMHKAFEAAVGRAVASGRDHLLITDLSDNSTSSTLDRASAAARDRPVH